MITVHYDREGYLFSGQLAGSTPQMYSGEEGEVWNWLEEVA